MDEESWRDRILQRVWSFFPQREAGSKGQQNPSAEVRPFQGGAAALESEGIALTAGPGAAENRGWAQS